MGDDPSFAARLEKSLSSSGEFCLSSSFPSGAAAIRSIPRAPPDLLLVEVQLPDMPGAECVREFRALLPKLPIILLAEVVDAAVLFQALAAGAIGLVEKSTPPDELLGHLRAALRGEAALSGAASHLVLGAFRQLGSLTPRDAQILSLLLAGKQYKEIAQELGIEVSTVHTHLSRLFHKYEVHSWRDLVRKVLSPPGANPL